MSDYPMLISNKLHSFRNFIHAKVQKTIRIAQLFPAVCYFFHKKRLLFRFFSKFVRFFESNNSLTF